MCDDGDYYYDLLSERNKEVEQLEEKIDKLFAFIQAQEERLKQCTKEFELFWENIREENIKQRR